MAHRTPGRFLAPLALLAALAAVALVVNSTTGGEEEGGSRSSETSTSTDAQRTSSGENGGSGGGGSPTGTTSTSASSTPKTYTVKAGDTLGSIAESAGVSIEELQELNPDVDPQSLSVGQRLRVRR